LRLRSRDGLLPRRLLQHRAAGPRAAHGLRPDDGGVPGVLPGERQRPFDARPEYGFLGLRPGDRWCLCAERWKEAWLAGAAPKVVLASTHVSTLDHVPLEALTEYAMPGRERRDG
jgi:hypothetical protein